MFHTGLRYNKYDSNNDAVVFLRHSELGFEIDSNCKSTLLMRINIAYRPRRLIMILVFIGRL